MECLLPRRRVQIASAAFTLVELLVVIAIIGILIALYPSHSGGAQSGSAEPMHK